MKRFDLSLSLNLKLASLFLVGETDDLSVARSANCGAEILRKSEPLKTAAYILNISRFSTARINYCRQFPQFALWATNITPSSTVRSLSKIDKESKRLFTIDFLLVTEALKDVWETRELIEWKEGETWTVSREGLIKLKTISGREQDLLDLKKLNEVENES